MSIERSLYAAVRHSAWKPGGAPLGVSIGCTRPAKVHAAGSGARFFFRNNLS